jgi:hypothetical protein
VDERVLQGKKRRGKEEKEDRYLTGLMNKMEEKKKEVQKGEHK